MTMHLCASLNGQVNKITLDVCSNTEAHTFPCFHPVLLKLFHKLFSFEQKNKRNVCKSTHRYEVEVLCFFEVMAQTKYIYLRRNSSTSSVVIYHLPICLYILIVVLYSFWYKRWINTNL